MKEETMKERETILCNKCVVPILYNTRKIFPRFAYIVK